MIQQILDTSDTHTIEDETENYPKHSTPIKTTNKEKNGSHGSKKTEIKQSFGRSGDARVISPSLVPSKLSQSSSPKHNTSNNQSFHQNSLELSTIQKQRTEIQLLVGELRERDKELNETVASHQKQLLSWEQDRERLVVLERKCQRYKVELTNRTTQLERASLKLSALETECTSQLESNKEKITQLTQERKKKSSLLSSLEDRNRNLNDSLKDASCTVGQLAAREQELVTLVKLKERELVDLRQLNSELSSHNQKMEARCKEFHRREKEAFSQSTHWQKKYNHSLVEIDKLVGDIKERDEVLTQQIKQISEAQQHMIALQEALIVSSDREKCKDELIASLKAKQERTGSELRSIRELFERQQKEITRLQLTNSTAQLNQSTIQDISFVDPDVPAFDQSQSNSIPTNPQPHINKISFDDRLSRFLDFDRNSPPTKGSNSEDNEAREVNLDETPPLHSSPSIKMMMDASPGSKLQRLLAESKLMIDSLEKSTMEQPKSTPQKSKIPVNQSLTTNQKPVSVVTSLPVVIKPETDEHQKPCS